MSFAELLVILLVALIVIPPKRLPEIAFILGRLLSRLRGLLQMFLFHK